VNVGLVNTLKLLQEIVVSLQHLPEFIAAVVVTTVDIQIFCLPEVINV
jgi:hypothetical protein